MVMKLNKMVFDEKKIEKAARQISEKVVDAIGFDDSKPTHLAFLDGHVDGFNAGAKWAINEFLKDLWHQTNKEPEGYDEWILLHYSVGNYYSLAQVKEFKSWKGFVEKMPIDGWLCIDDLFSKEGGECK
nr:MAG TPA: hypothetical protein [Caudoviricetes sp.]